MNSSPVSVLEHPPELAERLRRALAARGEGWVPRTRHLDDQGRPLFTNRLIEESSPYLLQHAHNPVDWFPWGDEAFERAARLVRPVLLSVGYSTCHWCHVMEHESFEDLEIAALINAAYVPIKVDREVRPDVDNLYMGAVQAVSGRGGWPMTVWLDAQRRPFYAGTYYPPRAGARGSPVGFLEVLARLVQLYHQDPERIRMAAEQLSQEVLQMLTPPRPAAVSGEGVLDKALRSLWQEFDEEHGGFGSAPKFPMPPSLSLCLIYDHFAADGPARAVALTTLRKMAAGGIHDQIGGGFHRYSTDERWLVPHFEKMMYDQGLLAGAYLDGWKVDGGGDLRRVLEELLTYVRAEMTAPSGAFYAATDADSEGEEGTFFVWTKAQLHAALGHEDAELAAAWWGVSAEGNFEGKSVLHQPTTLEALAARLQEEPSRLEARLSRARAALYRARSFRPAPHLDSKIVTAWSAMMSGAMARAAFALDRPDLAEEAARSLRALLGGDNRPRRLADGGPPAFSEDVAWVISASLDLFEATGAPPWLRLAIELQGWMDQRFADDREGGYFLTPHGAEALLAREKPWHEGVMPSANAVAAHNLLRLFAWTDVDALRERAEKTLECLGRYVGEAPHAVPWLACAWARARVGARTVVVVLPVGAAGGPLVEVLRTMYLPLEATVVVDEAAVAALEGVAPVLAGKGAPSGRPTAYVCESGRCLAPIHEADALRSTLLSWKGRRGEALR